ncbi:hypothetical protein Tco_0316440 [Tanacetum coccineum]
MMKHKHEEETDEDEFPFDPTIPHNTVRTPRTQAYPERERESGERGLSSYLLSLYNSVDEGMKKIIKEHKSRKEVLIITSKIEELVIDQLAIEVLVHSSKKPDTSHAVAANLSELELKKILIDKMEANNSININIPKTALQRH